MKRVSKMRFGPCVSDLGAALLSGLGAGWAQRLTRQKSKSAYLFSAEISFYSSAHLVASILFTSGFETLYPRANLFQEKQALDTIVY